MLFRSLGAFGGLGGFQTTFSLFYYLKNLLWFTLPAWPLAAWTLSRPRIREKNWSVLCISWLLIVLSILAVSPQRLQDNLVWLLPPEITTAEKTIAAGTTTTTFEIKVANKSDFRQKVILPFIIKASDNDNVKTMSGKDLFVVKIFRREIGRASCRERV